MLVSLSFGTFDAEAGTVEVLYDFVAMGWLPI